MSVVKWDPFQDISALQDRINSLFEESFGCAATEDPGGLCTWQPVVDILEGETGIVLYAEIPGVDKKDVEVEVRDNIITIRGDRRAAQELPDNYYLRRERCFGRFQRSFTLPHAVAPDRIKAVFKNGLLEITLPRPEADPPRQITIDVE